MKLLIAFTCFLSGLFFSMDVSDDAIAALKQGNAKELVKSFNEKVSIKIINQEDVLSRSQAEANMKYFFEKHPVKNFSSIHVNPVNDISQYITGTLETTSGKFRVSILVKRNVITQFRIENDNE